MKRAVPIAFALMFALHVPRTNAQSAPRKDIPAIAKAANGAIVSIVMSDTRRRELRLAARVRPTLCWNSRRVLSMFQVES